MQLLRLRRVAVLTALVVLSGATLVRAEPREGGPAPDARLEVKVSARLVDAPLNDWLARLSNDTGVGLRTASDYEDRAITLRVDGVSLKELMRGVATLYGDTWVRRGPATRPDYILQASPSRKRLQASMLRAFKGGLAAEITDQIRSTIKDGPKPWMLEGGDGERFAAELKGRAEVLSHLTPEAMDQLMAGNSIRLNLADAKGKPAESLWKFAEEFAMPAATGWTPQDRAKAWVHFSAEPYSLPQFALRGITLRRFQFTFGGPQGRSSSYSIVAHPDDLANRLGKDLEPLYRSQEQEPAERKRVGGERLKRRIRDAAGPLQAGPPTARSLVLVALAEETRTNLLCDSHIKDALPRPELTSKSLQEALDLAAAHYTSLWRAEGNTFLVRSRYWWLDDPAEPPASKVEKWRDTLKQHGAFSLSEAAEMASLSAEQQQRLTRVLPEASAAFSPWLRLYSTLNAKQREAAAADKGLEFWTLTEEQRHILRARSADDPELGNSNQEGLVGSGAAMLRVTQERAQNATVVVFALRPVPDLTGKVRFSGIVTRLLLPATEGRAKERP